MRMPYSFHILPKPQPTDLKACTGSPNISITTISIMSLSQEFRDSNKAWAQKFNEEHPGFLKKLAIHQEPKMLWIGCSDSRVPESVLMGCLPGRVFVHRNIANQFPKSRCPNSQCPNSQCPNSQFPTQDNNSRAVLEYAVGHLGVEIIVVAGHSDCGGVKTAYEYVHGTKLPWLEPLKTLKTWVGPLIDLAKNEPIKSLAQAGEEFETQALVKLNELNITKQVTNVKDVMTEMKNEASKRRDENGEGEELTKLIETIDRVVVEGWFYDLETGLIRVI